MIAVILPLFALVATGWILGRWRGADPAGVVDIVLYIFMPVLLFTTLVRDPVTWTQAGQYLGWYAGFALIMWAVASLSGRLLRWPQAERGALGLVLTGANVGSYGIPVVLFVIGEHVLPVGMLLLVASNILAGTLGVYLAAGGHLRPVEAALSIFRLPLIYAVLLALAVQGLQLDIPPLWLDLAHQIGMTGPTLALVVLGLQLSRIHWGGSGLRIGSMAVARLAIGSCVGVFLALALGTQGDELATLVLMGCMPSTINSVILAAHFDTRPDLVGGACLVTTLLSPLVLMAALLWLGRM